MMITPRARTYLRSLKMVERKAFADKVGISLNHLQNITYEQKQAGVELACKIELISRGAISRRDIRPDLDWDLIQGTRVAADIMNQPATESANDATRDSRNF